MRFARITEPLRQRYRCAHDYTRAFARYLGRALTYEERAVIHPLEKARCTGLIPRFMVLDRNGNDSRPILIQYMAWRDTCHMSAIMARTRTEARALVPYGVPEPRYYFTGRKPDNARGVTLSHALILDVNRYGVFSPQHRESRFYRITCAIAPMVNYDPDSFIVIHTTEPMPPPPGFEYPKEPPELGIEPVGEYESVIVSFLLHINGPSALSAPPSEHIPEEEDTRCT